MPPQKRFNYGHARVTKLSKSPFKSDASHRRKQTSERYHYNIENDTHAVHQNSSRQCNPPDNLRYDYLKQSDNLTSVWSPVDRLRSNKGDTINIDTAPKVTVFTNKPSEIQTINPNYSIKQTVKSARVVTQFSERNYQQTHLPHNTVSLGNKQNARIRHKISKTVNQSENGQKRMHTELGRTKVQDSCEQLIERQQQTHKYSRLKQTINATKLIKPSNTNNARLEWEKIQKNIRQYRNDKQVSVNIGDMAYIMEDSAQEEAGHKQMLLKQYQPNRPLKTQQLSVKSLKMKYTHVDKRDNTKLVGTQELTGPAVVPKILLNPPSSSSASRFKELFSFQVSLDRIHRQISRKWATKIELWLPVVSNQDQINTNHYRGTKDLNNHQSEKNRYQGNNNKTSNIKSVLRLEPIRLPSNLTLYEGQVLSKYLGLSYREKYQLIFGGEQQQQAQNIQTDGNQIDCSTKKQKLTQSRSENHLLNGRRKCELVSRHSHSNQSDLAQALNMLIVSYIESQGFFLSWQHIFRQVFGLPSKAKPSNKGEGWELKSSPTPTPIHSIHEFTAHAASLTGCMFRNRDTLRVWQRAINEIR